MKCKTYKVHTDGHSYHKDLVESPYSAGIHNGYYTMYNYDWPLEYKREYFYKVNNKYIYTVLDKSNGTEFRIALNWFENQRFLFVTRKHWILKEENIRYVINIIFLIIGVVFGFLKLKS